VRKIQGEAKTVGEVLKDTKYSIDYYQREYKWQTKQIQELMDDLCNKFMDDYQPLHPRSKVAEYQHYFLGSIIITEKDTTRYIVDGQQRLTTLTLLLIMLRNIANDRGISINVDALIYSEEYGQKSFNLHVDERVPAMDALYNGHADTFNSTEQAESIQNLLDRYDDLVDSFAEELQGDALPYFVDWLLKHVHVVEITAFSDDDAYTIFETMNDRGLSLSPTDMLKSYLLTNIDKTERTNMNNAWRKRIRELNDVGKEVEPDCFKAWLRSQYAESIRERKKGAKPLDFDRIGTEFHRWLRDSAAKIGLKTNADFYRFIQQDFDFYSNQYLRLMRLSQKPENGLEHVLYNAHHGFTLQYMLLIAPLQPHDDKSVIDSKIGLVARYLDILLTWRLWNFRSIAYSTLKNNMFTVMCEIRGLELAPLADKLHHMLSMEEETFASNARLRLHQQNRRFLHRILARLTDYVETQSGQSSRYIEYVSEGKGRYEVEHIWANHAEQHRDEFSHEADFSEHRNRIGALLLLPKSFNGSYGDLPYSKKLPHYIKHNLLAQSLHPECYKHNPGFLRFKQESGLPFEPIEKFDKSAVEARSELYGLIASRLWNPDDLLDMVRT